jgi:hypothetical protein
MQQKLAVSRGAGGGTRVLRCGLPHRLSRFASFFSFFAAESPGLALAASGAAAAARGIS